MEKTPVTKTIIPSYSYDQHECACGMRLLSKSTTRWQLLRLISVWGATILCLYCITVGTNFRESMVENRLANEIHNRNLSRSADADTTDSSTNAVLFKPEVIIFGAGKCGTRALIEFLKMHPNIASARAEVHYFDENLDKGVEWYRTRMPLSYSNQVTLEKSPSYLWEPRAPEELYKINRDVKLILLVKDPVVRIMSQAARMDDAEHRHELLFLTEIDGKKTVKNDSNTVAAGLYVEHLKNWLKIFPLEQIHVIEGMQLIRNPYKEIKKVEEFLELPKVLTEANFFLNESRGFYCPYPFYSRLPECLSEAKGVPHPKLRPEAEKLIYNFYRPYNEKLFQIIGKRFDWEPKKETT
ncbi:sulfotransferase [Elysia marginata]|uniref:Sulfotransferase n=1 Tax=Elysia marginata TaxID=1093978 RepID=A0AAV4GWX2_9GAST|nr:sulfotransferase [Elysia marginata]